MKANKVLLVLDNSNLMFRSLFMSQLYGAKVNYDRIEDMRSFVYKFATDVCSIINIFHPNKILVAADAQHAWRKNVLPGDNGYKSNRQKSEDINWDNVYKGSDDFLSILSKKGVNIGLTEHAEADDIVAMTKEIVFEKYPEYNIIIVSADADLRQLIDFNKETHQYCVVYNTTTHGKTGKRHFFATQDFIDWYNTKDEIDFFCPEIDQAKKYLQDLFATNSNIELTLENPTNILLGKIFCGDDGDAVPSFYEWVNNGKYTRVTPSRSKKIILENHITCIEDVINNPAGIEATLSTIAKKKINDIDVKERIQRQRYLVELNSQLFPIEIQKYKDTIDAMLQLKWIYNQSEMKAPALLEGSEYENANQKKALKAEVFKDVSQYLEKYDNLTKNSLFE